MPSSPKEKNKKMAPVSNMNNGSSAKSISSKKKLSANELADHLEDLHTSSVKPARSASGNASSPRQPVDQSFLAFRAAGSTSSLLSAGSTSSASSGSSGGSGSGSSNSNSKEVGEDFTLGNSIRTARRDSITRPVYAAHHHQAHHHAHHNQNIHCSVSSSKERYVFSK